MTEPTHPDFDDIQRSDSSQSISLADLRKLNQELCVDRQCLPNDHLALMTDKRKEINDPTLLAEIDIAIGKKHAHAGNAKLALQSLLHGQAHYESLPEHKQDYFWQGTLHSGLSIVYASKADFEMSLHHNLHSLEAYRKGDHTDAARASTLNAGLILLTLGLGDEAIKHINEVADSSNDDPDIMCRVHSLLGVINQATGDFEQAKQHYQTTISLTSSLQRKLVAFYDLISCNLTLGDIDKAEQLISEANDLVAIHELDTVMQIIRLITHAQLDTFYQEHERAKARCAEALTISIEADHPDLQNRVKLQQGNILLSEGKIDAGQTLLETLLQKQLWPTVKFELNSILLNLYETTEQWESAYRLLNKTKENRLFAQSQLHSIEQMLNSQRNEEILKKKNDELWTLHTENQEMFQIVMHDLKNPLTAAKFTAELLISYGPRISVGDLGQRYERIYASIDSSINIISQLGAVAQAEADADEVVLETLIVDHLVKEIFTENLPLATKKNQKLELIEHSLILVIGNSLWIKQILSNLISNAIKYSLPDATTSIRLSTDKSEGVVYIEVKDEGLGFSDEDMLNVFKKYKRLSAIPTGNETSTGLGLYISKKLANKMGGDISVTSEGKEKGSTFVVELPLCNDEN